MFVSVPSGDRRGTILQPRGQPGAVAVHSHTRYSEARVEAGPRPGEGEPRREGRASSLRREGGRPISNAPVRVGVPDRARIAYINLVTDISFSLHDTTRGGRFSVRHADMLSVPFTRWQGSLL